MSGTPFFGAPVDFRLAFNPPDSLPDNVKPTFDEVYNSLNQVFNTLVDFCGIGPQPHGIWDQLAGTPGTLLAGNLNRLYVVAKDTIIPGNTLNLTLDAGILKAQLADATNNTKPAQGFCNSLGVSPGGLIEMIMHSGVAPISGLTVGTRYYQSAASPGIITAAAPVAAGNIEQYVGVAITTTSLFFYTHHWRQH